VSISNSRKIVVNNETFFWKFSKDYRKEFFLSLVVQGEKNRKKELWKMKLSEWKLEVKPQEEYYVISVKPNNVRKFIEERFFKNNFSYELEFEFYQKDPSYWD
jgi:hypothetical protein